MFLDYRLIARDGRVVWIRDDEIVVEDTDGRPAAAQGYMQDVTARRQDSIRLELLVGILSLAADETPPDEIVAHAAESLAGALRRRRRQLRRRRATKAASGSATRPTTGNRSSGTSRVVSAEYVKRIEAGVRSSSRTSRRRPGSTRLRDQLIARNVVSSVDVPLLPKRHAVRRALVQQRPPSQVGDEDDVSILVDVAGQLAIVLGSARARELRALAENDLRSRDAILQAVSRSAERFLIQPSLDEGIVELMRVLGEATGVTSAYVFENVGSTARRRTSTARRLGVGPESTRQSTTRGSPISILPPTSHAGPKCSAAAASSAAASKTCPRRA